MKSLVSKLRADFHQFEFVSKSTFCWSPKNNQIQYVDRVMSSYRSQWTLLHELSHGLLNHTSYASDLELLTLEANAWEKAKDLAVNYSVTISEDHIQDCLDTYRDWLHQRSTCPRCKTTSLQSDSNHYKCFNCGQSWAVTSSRFCRPYRKLEHKKTSPAHSEQAMFI